MSNQKMAYPLVLYMNNCFEAFLSERMVVSSPNELISFTSIKVEDDLSSQHDLLSNNGATSIPEVEAVSCCSLLISKLFR